MSIPSKRLIIEIEYGIVTRIIADGIDLRGVQGVVIDHDPSDPESAIEFEGKEVFFSPKDIEQADDNTSREVRRAYDTWALS